MGKSKRKLKEAKVLYVVGKNTYHQRARSMVLFPKTGLVKLFFKHYSLKLPDIQIIGEKAPNMIHILSDAILAHR